MTVTHELERLSGSNYGGWTLPIFVCDDGTPPAMLTLSDVITYINGASLPTDINGIPDDGDPDAQDIGGGAWRVKIKYREPTLRPLRPPRTDDDQRFEMQFQLGRKYIDYAPEVDFFVDDTIYTSGGFSWGGKVHVKQQAGSGAISDGIWVDPPPVSFTTYMTVAPSTVTASWLRTLAAMIEAGTVNSTSLNAGAYAAGELMIVNCFLQQVSPHAISIRTGWNWRLNVTGETRGGVDSIAYDGQDLVWNWSLPSVDRDNSELSQKIAAVYVNQHRPRGDLSSTGLAPP